jgi:hypothetical protein
MAQRPGAGWGRLKQTNLSDMSRLTQFNFGNNALRPALWHIAKRAPGRLLSLSAVSVPKEQDALPRRSKTKLRVFTPLFGSFAGRARPALLQPMQ